jgi:cytochrome c oxidase cbb3-type subunit 3
VRTLVIATLFLTASGLVACDREQRRFSEVAPASGLSGGVQMSNVRVRNAARGDASVPYTNNAWAVAQGKQLYTAFNCDGCHADGGGGIGPPLLDAPWLYGSAPWEIYTSIAEGRPNGMPAYGHRVPDAQLWQVVAYVRTLSAQLRKDVRPGRSDHMMMKPSEQSKSPERPTHAPLPPAGMPK